MENTDKQEILQAIAALDVKLTTRIDGLDAKVTGLDAKIDASHSELVELIQDLSTSTDERFTTVEKELGKIRAEMVTKDYLDRKLADKEMDTLEFVKKTYVRQ